MTKPKEKRFPILGERMRELRGELSQNKFSKRVGVTAATIGYYENSDRLPDAETLHKICTECNVSADYLLGIASEKTMDTDTRAICERTGLSEQALNFIEMLNKCSKSVDNLDCSEVTREYLEKVAANKGGLTALNDFLCCKHAHQFLIDIYVLTHGTFDPLPIAGTDGEDCEYSDCGETEAEFEALQCIRDITQLRIYRAIDPILNSIEKRTNRETKTAR